MEFIKYPKINKHIKNHNIHNWVATEKIHGSNFSIYSNGQETKFAKRTTFLNISDQFYNYQSLIPKLESTGKQIFNLINTKQTKYIIIYGELFGGYYPSEFEIDNWNINQRINQDGKIIIPMNERAVQEGIYYNPNIEFIAFDILIVDNITHFLDYDTMKQTCLTANLNIVPEIATGNLHDLLNINLNFNSLVPNYFNLKPLENNIAEGIVIKNKTGNIRYITKIKHHKFSEICQKSGYNKKSGTSPKNILMNMINQNRLNNVLSKECNNYNKSDIITLLIDDIWTDFYINHNLHITNFDNINQSLEKECQLLIDKYLN